MFNANRSCKEQVGYRKNKQGSELKEELEEDLLESLHLFENKEIKVMRKEMRHKK